MKKKKTILTCGVIILVFLCISLILNSTKENYPLNWLVENSDYAVVAQRNILRCENTGNSYAMNAYNGKKPYKKEGKVYTEMYVLCPSEEYFGEKITVVTDGYYFKEEDYCFLFLNCIDKNSLLYTPVNDKTGIIKVKSRKLRPMDTSLNKDLKNNFSDAINFYNWFEDIIKQKLEKEYSDKTE